MFGQKRPKREAKIVLLGGKGVGKTCIIQQASTGAVNESIPAQTVTQTSFTSGPHEVLLKLYDIPGDDLMGVRSKSYCRTAQGVMFVYDIGSESSFKELSQVFGLVKSAAPHAKFMLVGNKNDGKRKVKKADALNIAKLHGFSHVEINAFNKKQTKAAFGELVASIFPDLPEQEEIREEIGGINDPQYGNDDDTQQLNVSNTNKTAANPTAAGASPIADMTSTAIRLVTNCCGLGRRA